MEWKTERRRKCSGDKNLTLKPSKNNNKPTEGETKKNAEHKSKHQPNTNKYTPYKQINKLTNKKCQIGHCVP